MAFVFLLEAGEVICHTLLFQAVFLQFSWHKWLFSSLWKQGKLIITLCHFNSCFCYFLHVNYFCCRSGSRGSYSTPFVISIRFPPFSGHKWLLFSFWKQGKSFITLRFFNPYFRYFLDINDLFSFWKHGNWFITHCYFSSCFLHFLDTNYLFS